MSNPKYTEKQRSEIAKRSRKMLPKILKALDINEDKEMDEIEACAIITVLADTLCAFAKTVKASHSCILSHLEDKFRDADF